MKQRGLSALLAATLLCSLLPVTACAANNDTYDTENAKTFRFSDSAITATGEDGYKIEGTALTIQESGTYLVTGTCSDGSIKVKKGTTDVVLILDDLDLTSKDTAPISCNKSTEVTIVALEGSTNTLTDAEENNDENYPDNTEAENAVIKCKDGSQVTLAGTGSLTLHARAQNGIKSGETTEEEGEAWLVIQDLALTIDCPVNDGINAQQSLSIPSGTLTIAAGDDGLHCDYDLTIGKTGTEGPTILVTESYEGIEASNITVASGKLTTHSTDDGMNAANSDLKGASFSIAISGGTVYVDALGDGLDSNGTLTISGGTISVFSASSGDNQPLDADGSVTVSGGTVLAVGSSGMGMKLNASQPYVIFGSTAQMGGGQKPDDQTMQDPGQRSDGQTMQDPGQRSDGQTMQDPGQRPDGGQTMQDPGQRSGGETMQKPDGQMEPPDGQGTGTGMGSGGQMGSQDTILSANMALTIQDAEGNTMISAETERSASYVFFSSSKLVSGSTYTLCGNGSALGTATAATESSGTSQSGQPIRPDTQTETQTDTQTEAQKSRFQDVSNTDWYYDAVSYAVGKNLMNGTSETAFEPNGETTRGMLVTILYRLAGSPATNGTCPFSDVGQEDYYRSAVCWAYENGIVNGISDTTFSPNARLTREQLATILYRYGEWKGVDVSGRADLAGFTDQSRISTYAREAMGWANKSGLINGITDTEISPATVSTRAQVATILMRFCENLLTDTK